MQNVAHPVACNYSTSDNWYGKQSTWQLIKVLCWDEMKPTGACREASFPSDLEVLNMFVNNIKQTIAKRSHQSSGNSQSVFIEWCGLSMWRPRWAGRSSWELVEYPAPCLPGMCVCSAERCLNRMTSYSHSDLQLSLFAVKNLCLSCSVILPLTYLGRQVTHRPQLSAPTIRLVVR